MLVSGHEHFIYLCPISINYLQVNYILNSYYLVLHPFQFDFGSVCNLIFTLSFVIVGKLEAAPGLVLVHNDSLNNLIPGHLVENM